MNMLAKLKKFNLDATDQAIGRLATQIAMILMGKNDPSYQPNVDCRHKVIITNAAKIKLSGKKLEQKEYIHYSGYPGGIKRLPFKKVLAAKPEQVILKAVSRMLPKNKLRVSRLKRISFK